MIVNPYVGLAGYSGGFAGAWEDWCDQNYYTAENNAKCKVCPVKLPIVGTCITPAPHTMAGRAARKLPQQTDLERLGPPVTVPDPSVPPPSSGGIVPPASGGDELIAGVPNWALGVGAALLGGGAFYAMSRRGGGRRR